MSCKEIYLDSNATTRPLGEVVAVVADCLGESFGNASSPHSRGQRCRAVIERARDAVAQMLDADPETLIFTASGTEANNMVLQRPVHRLLTTAVEHASVLKTAAFLARQGAEVIYLPVDAQGLINLDQLVEHLDRFHPDLVSIQWANSETGVVQPMAVIAELCQVRNISLHTDAAQAVGRLPISVEQIPVDFLTFTGHKLHAPPGVGVLYCREPATLAPLVHGGDQERGHRPGTENLPAIAGLGRAVDLRRQTFEPAVVQLHALRDCFETDLQRHLDTITVNGHPTYRVANTSNLRFAGIDGQALVAQLDRHGIHASQTSACSSSRPEPSHVLRAMGLSEEAAFQSVRFSFSVLNTEEEVAKAVTVIGEICQRLAQFSLL